jgi:8-oxo-dGTP diphosphatase
MKRTTRKASGRAPARSAAPVRQQVSAGGVAFRARRKRTEIVLVSVAAQDAPRWQLPKGLVDAGETPQAAALREVREEAGIAAELVAPIETIEYWYAGEAGGQRVRFHKFVHFFLLAYQSGDVADHDSEVLEARWVDIDEAVERLAFDNERRVVEAAREWIRRMAPESSQAGGEGAG